MNLAPNPADNPAVNLGANPSANPTAKPRQTRTRFAFLGLVVALLIVSLLGGAGAFYFNKTAKDAKKTAQQIKQAQIKKDEVIGDIIVPTPEPTPPPVIVPPTPTPPTEPPMVSVYRYGRTLLNDNEKAAYDEILSQALRYENAKIDNKTPYMPNLNITLQTNIDDATLSRITSLISVDCPETFHILNFIPRVTKRQGTFVREFYVRAYAGYESQEKYFAKMNQILAKTQPIFDKMNAATSQIDKIKIAHDELLKIVAYINTLDAGNIVGAFIDGLVVCEGYSKALLFLLQRGGLSALFTIGYGNGGLHAWNVVSHNGAWYFIDSTWDDGITGVGFHHGNFMKGTDDFIKVNKDSIGQHQYTYEGKTAVSYPQMPQMSKTSLKGNWN